MKNRFRGGKIAVARLCQAGLTMRTMRIPPFPDRVEIADIATFTNARLAGEFKFSEQARPWLGICSIRPAKLLGLRSDRAPLVSRSAPAQSKGMRRIQYQWLRVADVFHLYYDMAIGGHQSRRGGATISKAVHLAAKNTKSSRD